MESEFKVLFPYLKNIHPSDFEQYISHTSNLTTRKTLIRTQISTLTAEPYLYAHPDPDLNPPPNINHVSPVIRRVQSRGNGGAPSRHWGM